MTTTMPGDSLPLFPAAGVVEEVPGCGVVEDVVGREVSAGVVEEVVGLVGGFVVGIVTQGQILDS